MFLLTKTKNYWLIQSRYHVCLITSPWKKTHHMIIAKYQYTNCDNGLLVTCFQVILLFRLTTFAMLRVTLSCNTGNTIFSCISLEFFHLIHDLSRKQICTKTVRIEKAPQHMSRATQVEQSTQSTQLQDWNISQGHHTYHQILLLTHSPPYCPPPTFPQTETGYHCSIVVTLTQFKTSECILNVSPKIRQGDFSTIKVWNKFTLL